jgi:hypothetical protein
MPTVTVTDLVVTTRKVKLPAYCPGCGGRLKEDRALHIRGFVDETRTGRLPKSGDDKMDAIAGVVLDDAGYDSGEEFINNVSVTCRRCSRVLASGTYTVTPTSEGRHARQREQR